MDSKAECKGVDCKRNANSDNVNANSSNNNNSNQPQAMVTMANNINQVKQPLRVNEAYHTLVQLCDDCEEYSY
jgi:hypothetical protein